MNKSNSTDIKSLVKSLFSKSVASLMIKIVSAGLAYLMFVALARAMSEVNYGQFAFGFALASILAVGATMGQHIAILRFWPEETGKDKLQKAKDSLKSGWAITIISGIIITIAMIAIVLLAGYFTTGISSIIYIIAAALLILPLALAEYGSAALLAQGSIWTSLTPKDVLWRASVPTIIWILLFYGIELSGTQALLLATFILSLVIMVQFIISNKNGYYNSVGFSALKTYLPERGKITFWFFIASAIEVASMNIDIVLVGLFITVESAGLYFNAFRTAGLLTLFMWATTLVVAPMIAKHFHVGEIRKAQAITTFTTWIGFILSVGVFIIFVFFGDFILSLFGDVYSEGKIILLIISAGMLVEAATGPTRIVMMMTGHEKAFVTIYGTLMLLGILLFLIFIPIFGIIGAAVINMLTRAVAQTAIAFWAKRKIGLNTTLLGGWKLPKDLDNKE